MKTTALKNHDGELIKIAWVATSPLARFLGLMGRKEIPKEEAMVFPNCNSIHTFFMRFPIDVVMVGKDGIVVEVIESMKPWRLLLPRWQAKHVIELKAGRARDLGVVVGTQLNCGGAW